MKNSLAQKLVLASSLVAALALTGCSALSPIAATAPLQGSALKGRVMGGQQPVSFATVQLWATSTSGYGSASTALITSASAAVNNASYPVMTDAGGNFAITGDFTCPTPSTTPVYITITGGNPGNGGGILNPNLALMAALGPCNNLVNIPFVNISEISTVASVWALSSFMTDMTHIGTSSSNMTGMALAMAAVNKLYNLGSGTIGGPALPTGATLPADEIYGLADILSVCINSTGGVATDTSTNCGKLFSLVKPGVTAPTDTVTAAMNIAQNPSFNADALWRTIPSIGAVFATSVGSPAAWTIAINYTGGGLSTPKGIANDASGNVWLPNAGNNSVTELSNTGVAQSGTNGYTAVGAFNLPSAIAIDSSNNPWVTNFGNGSLTKLSSAGTPGTPITGNGLSTPKSISFDPIGNIWMVNYGSNSVSAFTGTGAAIGNYTGGGISTPIGIAVNPQ